MLVPLVGADATTHYVAFQAQDQINDCSGALAAPAVGAGAAFQQIVAANVVPPGTPGCRCGFLFQNTSQRAMVLNEVNGEESSSWIVETGAYWPPIPGTPVPTGAIGVMGGLASQAGDTFAAREYVNAPGE